MPRSAVRFDALERRCHLTAVAFEVDSKLSSLTITASARVDDVGSVKLGSQEDGLDTANYGGTLLADVSSKGVKFNGGSEINAIEHAGSFSPGSGPAAYALDGKVKKIITLAEVEAAVRDLQLDITNSSRKKIVGDKRRFQMHRGEITVTRGAVDYELDSKFGDAEGSESLDGQKTDLQTSHGRITGKKGSRVLTVPIVVKYTRELENGVDGVFTFKGQIVGREKSSPTAQAATFSAKPIEAKQRDDDDRVASQLAL